MIDIKILVIGGVDYGISEVFYLDDLDGNGIEIYVDKLENEWLRFDEVVNSLLDY